VLRNLTSVALACLLAGATASAQQRNDSATLRLVVKDPSGAVIPGALVRVTGAEARTSAVTRTDVPSNGQGVATTPDLVPGRYTIAISFPGFETLTIPDVRLRAGDNKRDAVLKIQKIEDSVSVGRDKAAVAADPNNDRFNTVLSRDQINALPDDPDEMERVLKEMAGPGATIRVDGFRGGKLPPKSQIRSIRFLRDAYAAENHMAGMVFVDIVTQPGMGPLRGSLDVLFRDDSLNARNAFTPEKGPEQTQQYTLNLSGTLRKERTSFSLSATGTTLYDSANIYAGTLNGVHSNAIRRPSDRLNVNGRLDHALNNAHTLRANVQTNANQAWNLGVGGYDLSTRAYSRRTDEALVRLSETGPLSKTLFAESRFQLRRQENDTFSDLEARTERVLDTFTAGGAQQAGGRHSSDVEFATNVDWALKKHAVRFGALVEGGWYRSDSRTNYLGTFVFPSRADYDAGLPASYTQRIGNPLVEYTHWQSGLYVQDDWRARSSLTISAGLRQEFQTHLDDGLNLAPRVGFTWAPFKNGKTTVRGGGGVFYDWLESEIYEQVLRVDGVKQRDLVVTNPGYPDPLSEGIENALPASKYTLADDLVMPYRVLGNLGVSHQFTPTLSANVSYTRTRGYDRFRGLNINAPLNGARPDPAVGNVTEVQSTAEMRSQMLVTGLNFNIPARRMFLFANYAWIKQESNSEGPFALPANNYDLSGEWGPVTGVPRHTLSGMFTSTVMKAFRVSLAATWRSGTPYNMTTGHDDNGDTVFNDRPAAVSRNTARTEMMWDVNTRVSYAFGFGQRPPSAGGPAGTPVVVMHRVGGGGNDIAGVFGGGAEDKRIRFEVFASASNLFNAVNKIGYSGVMTSPFFLEPTAAMPGRRIDIGVRVGF
jgi:carboxypeptidase family protein